MLAARSDAVSAPEPRSVGELADRLQRPGSVALALPRLARPYLQVAEALAALGAPATRDALSNLLGVADGERIPLLLQAWRTLPLTPAQARDEEGKTLPALAGAQPCDGCAQARQGLLTAAANLPAGRGVQNAPDLGLLVAWHRPLADRLPQDDTPFATVIHEAELLGVLARGALSGIGAALAADDTEGLSAGARRLLPAATGTAQA